MTYNEDLKKIGNPITRKWDKIPPKFGTKILELSRNLAARVFILAISFDGTWSGSLPKFGTKNLEPSRNPITKTFVIVIGLDRTRSPPTFGTKILVPGGEKLKT